MNSPSSCLSLSKVLELQTSTTILDLETCLMGEKSTCFFVVLQKEMNRENSTRYNQRHRPPLESPFTLLLQLACVQKVTFVALFSPFPFLLWMRTCENKIPQVAPPSCRKYKQCPGQEWNQSKKLPHSISVQKATAETPLSMSPVNVESQCLRLCQTSESEAMP